MKKEELRFEYESYTDFSELNPEDAALVQAARDVTANAYAPYSNFLVGAAAKLSNGEIVKGTNQENASYPVGICAERSLLATAASLYNNVPIDTLAVSYHNLNGDSSKPVSPCGMCRQALREYEDRTKQPIRLILSGMEGKIIILERSTLLLPMSFGGEDMK
jgi:cytidine deaminase